MEATEPDRKILVMFPFGFKIVVVSAATPSRCSAAVLMGDPLGIGTLIDLAGLSYTIVKDIRCKREERQNRILRLQKASDEIQYLINYTELFDWADKKMSEIDNKKSAGTATDDDNELYRLLVILDRAVLNLCIVFSNFQGAAETKPLGALSAFWRPQNRY
jgi:hypothetical protein